MTRPFRWHPRGLNNALIFSATYYGVTHLPPRVSYGIGHVGTWLASRAMRSGTAALIENLRVVRPGASERELHELALLTYRSYARDTIDFLRSLRMSEDELWSMIQRVDTSSLDGFVREGRGALLATAHFGNWELGGVILRKLYGYPTSVVVMSELSPVVNRLRKEFRSRLDIDTFEVRQSMDTPLRLRNLLAAGQVVGMLLDRYVGRDRVAVDFFGRRAYFLRTPALMSYLTGCPLIPAFLSRAESGRISGVCLPPIHVSREGDRDASVKQAVQQFATLLEDQIRQHPHFWYQFYPFWESQELATEEPLADSPQPAARST